MLRSNAASVRSADITNAAEDAVGCGCAHRARVVEHGRAPLTRPVVGPEALGETASRGRGW
jgi:hypothetical protein